METKACAKCHFKKLSFGNSSQKARKSGYQTFLVLSTFTGFLYIVPNILAGIEVQCSAFNAKLTYYF